MGTTLVVNEVLCAPLIYRLMQYQKTDVFSTQIVEFMGWKASLVPRLSNNRESLSGILVNCFLWSIPPLVPFVPPTNQFLLLVHTMHILASIHTHMHTHHHVCLWSYVLSDLHQLCVHGTTTWVIKDFWWHSTLQADLPSWQLWSMQKDIDTIHECIKTCHLTPKPLMCNCIKEEATSSPTHWPWSLAAMIPWSRMTATITCVFW